MMEKENMETPPPPQDTTMIEIHSEKVEYRHKLLEMEKDIAKKEREEKKKELELLRLKKNIGKKTNNEKTIYSPIQKDLISPTSKSCFVQIRMLDGSTNRVEFQTEDLLSRICEYIYEHGKFDEKNEEKYESGFIISTTHPKRKFTIEEIETLTIEKSKVVNQCLIVEVSFEGFKLKEKPLYEYIESILPEWKMKGDL
jgi:hypothetical protein